MCGLHNCILQLSKPLLPWTIADQRTHLVSVACGLLLGSQLPQSYPKHHMTLETSWSPGNIYGYGILWHLMTSYGIYGSNLWYVHCTQFVHVLTVRSCSLCWSLFHISSYIIIYLQRALEDAVCIYHIDPYRMIPSTCRTEWNIMLSPQCNGCNGCNGCNAVLCDCTSICFWPGRAALWDNPLEEKMEKDGKGGNHRAAAPPQERQKQSHPVINATLTHCQVASECLFRLQVLLN